MSKTEEERFLFDISIARVIRDGDNLIINYTIETVAGEQETSFPLAPFVDGRIPMDEEQLEEMIREDAEPLYRRNMNSVNVESEVNAVVDNLKTLLEGKTLVKKTVIKKLSSATLTLKNLPEPDEGVKMDLPTPDEGVEIDVDEPED